MDTNSTSTEAARPAPRQPRLRVWAGRPRAALSRLHRGAALPRALAADTAPDVDPGDELLRRLREAGL